jgi:hypothetical protein
VREAGTDDAEVDFEEACEVRVSKERVEKGKGGKRERAGRYVLEG